MLFFSIKKIYKIYFRLECEIIDYVIIVIDWIFLPYLKGNILINYIRFYTIHLENKVMYKANPV
ncbi:hypothetical protein TVTCOM_16890 [Terrisporobacter vanillatitrophus]